MSSTKAANPSPFLCLACGEEAIIAGPWPQRECVACGSIYSTLEAAEWRQADVPGQPGQRTLRPAEAEVGEQRTLWR